VQVPPFWQIVTPAGHGSITAAVVVVVVETVVVPIGTSQKLPWNDGVH